MKIREAIKDWPNLNWEGAFAGSDRMGPANPATTVIRDVSDRSDRDGHKIRIDVEANNRPFSDKQAVAALVFFTDEALFDRVFTALKSTIGKTLNDAGNISI